MNVVPILVLCSLGLAALAVLLFLYSARQGDPDHAVRLSLLPLEDDDARPRKSARGDGGT